MAGDLEAGRAVPGARPRHPDATSASRACRWPPTAGLEAEDRPDAERIEKERTPAGKDALAIKTGTGGLMDAEFIAQTLCLAHGWQEPNTLRALERGRRTACCRRPTRTRSSRTTASCAGSRASCAAGATRAKRCCPTIRRRSYRVAVRCGFARRRIPRGAGWLAPRDPGSVLEVAFSHVGQSRLHSVALAIGFVEEHGGGAADVERVDRGRHGDGDGVIAGASTAGEMP